MIDVIYCEGDSRQSGGLELIERWKSNPDSWIWLNFFGEDPKTEAQLLQETFEIDEALISEAQRDRHPPSFETYSKFMFCLLKPLDAESNSLDFGTLQMALFVGQNFLITRHNKPSPYLIKIRESVLSGSTEIDAPIDVFVLMSYRVAHRYGRILLDLEERLDEIEDELFSSPTDTLMKELVSYNTSLRKVHRILNYYITIYKMVDNHFESHDLKRKNDAADVFALMERFHSLAGLYQGVINDLIEAYISLNGHRLNQIMKVLTIVTVIFVPLTLLVGIYGMNFEYIPELKMRYGYFVLLSVMGVIGASLLVLFKKLKWI